jgi:hypothetical protein
MRDAAAVANSIVTRLMEGKALVMAPEATLDLAERARGVEVSDTEDNGIGFPCSTK